MILTTFIDVKQYLKKNFPIAKKILDFWRNINQTLRVQYRELNPRPMDKVFSHISQTNYWYGSDSLSGHGSDLASTEYLRKNLPDFLKQFYIKTILDIPCGDFVWMKLLDYSFDYYLGGDIVPDIIMDNIKQYEMEKRKFQVLDITSSPLPQVDVIFCRDCLVHLSHKQIKAAIQNFKASHSKYLLTTTYPNLRQYNSHTNKNIVTGDWRPLDLQDKPFCFPQPLALLHENCATDLPEKCLGLWRITDL